MACSALQNVQSRSGTNCDSRDGCGHRTIPRPRNDRREAGQASQLRAIFSRGEGCPRACQFKVVVGPQPLNPLSALQKAWALGLLKPYARRTPGDLHAHLMHASRVRGSLFFFFE